MKTAGVFLDQSKAEIISFEGGVAAFMESVISDYGGRERFDGEGNDDTRFTSDPYHGSNNEFKKHRIEENELKAYFKFLAEKLNGFDRILLFGPGEGKKQFSNYVADLNTFKGKQIFVESSDKMTTNQLLEFVREYYGNLDK